MHKQRNLNAKINFVLCIYLLFIVDSMFNGRSCTIMNTLTDLTTAVVISLIVKICFF